MKDIKRRNTERYLFASGGSDGLQLWDVNPFTGALEANRIMTNVQRNITCIDFSNDKEFIYATTTSGDFLVFSVKHMKMIKNITVSGRTGLTSIISDFTTNHVFVGGLDGKARLYDMDRGNLVYEIQLDNSITGLSSSADRLEALIATSQGTVTRFNLSTQSNLVIAENHTKSIVAVSFSPMHQDRFATASLDGTIRVWDLFDYTVLTLTGLSACKMRSADSCVPTCLVFDAMLLTGWSDGK